MTDELIRSNSSDSTPDLQLAEDPSRRFAAWILLYSFVAAVLLAISGFAVVAVYLFSYLKHAIDTFNAAAIDQLAVLDNARMQSILLARAGLWKFILQSCGIISSVAFGFLGFSLFLLGIKGDMDANLDATTHKLSLVRLAPGSFIMFCAMVLIGVCSNTKVQLQFGPVKTMQTLSGEVQQSPPKATDNPVPSDSLMDCSILGGAYCGKGTSSTKPDHTEEAHP